MPGTFSPIAERQIGAVAYLFGITTSGSPISIQFMVGGIGGSAASGGSVELDSDDVSFTWKEKENTDTTGNVQNITQANFKYERTIRLIPSGATRAAAASYASQVLICDSMVVANYKVTAFNGNWRIKPGTKINLKMDDNAGLDISAEMYYNTSQNSALTGAPITG
jgi:hypothetical protein